MTNMHDIFCVEGKADDKKTYFFSTLSRIFNASRFGNTHSANIYLTKVNKRNTIKKCEIYSALTIKSPSGLWHYN